MAKKKSSNLQTSALLYIAIGILFIIFKATVLDWMMTGIGILFIINGIIDISRQKTVNGIVGIVIGAVIIIGGWAITDLILVIFGILLAIKGIVDLGPALKRKKLIPILSAALTVAAGVLVIIGKWVLLDWFFIALGIILIVDGIIALTK